MKSPNLIRLALALCVVSLLHGCAKAPTADNPPELTPAQQAEFDAAAAQAAAAGSAAAAKAAPPAPAAPPAQ